MTPYRNLNTTGRLVLAALAIVILVDVIAAVSDIAEYRLIARAIDGEFISDSEFDRNDTRQGAIGLGQTAVAIAAAILYLVWMFRARRNLDALGVEGLSFTHWWVIWVWFIPILNLFRPYQLTSEIARASDPRYPRNGEWWKVAAVPGVLGFWWGAWLINETIGRALFRTAFRDPNSLEDFRNRAILYLVSDTVDIIAAVLALVVVYGITTAQDKKAEVRQSGEDLPWDLQTMERI